MSEGLNVLLVLPLSYHGTKRNEIPLYQGCSQTKCEAVYSMDTKTKFSQKQATSVLFFIYYHFTNFEITFSSLVLSKWPSSCSVSNRFCILPEVFSYIFQTLLYGFGKKILRKKHTHTYRHTQRHTHACKLTNNWWTNFVSCVYDNFSHFYLGVSLRIFCPFKSPLKVSKKRFLLFGNNSVKVCLLFDMSSE